MTFENIHQAVKALQAGQPIILTDDKDRENEGDIIYAAEFITDEQVNFMLQHCSGIICLSIEKARAKCLGLNYMVDAVKNNSQYQTPFTVSIEAREGVTTGVSAADRAHTIRTAMNQKATADSLARPGHVFPLIAHEHGVLGRRGHTEGSVDFVKLAGGAPGAVLCELMNPDGTMKKGDALEAFAKQYDIPMVSIEELVQYRLVHECFLEKTAQSELHVKEGGDFTISYYRNSVSGENTVVLDKPFKGKPLVRVHSACFTGDLLGSLHCDCQSQLHHAMQLMGEEGGVLIYHLDQEGRGIGLENKIKAYALQQEGMNTLEANVQLGFPLDMRHYHDAAHILKKQGISECRLLTNNPEKISQLIQHGIQVDAVASYSECNIHNKHYLATKINQLNHSIKGVFSE